MGRRRPFAEPAFEACFGAADRDGPDPAAMALEFAAFRPSMGARLIGATLVARLDRICAALNIRLGHAVPAAIGRARRLDANPCP